MTLRGATRAASAALVVCAIDPHLPPDAYKNLTRHQLADVLVDRYYWGGKWASRIMRWLLHRYADKLDRREAG